MRVLVVCRQKQSTSPFITEQVEAMAAKGIKYEYFFIRGKGISAYMSSFSNLKKHIKAFEPDVIHAHYGLSGFFANWQRSVPVVTTYHGGDVNYDKARPFSKMAARLSKYNIYVSQKLALKAKAKEKFIILPCGINLDIFQPMDKLEARAKMNLDSNKTYALFSSAFNNPIKNAALAKEAVEKTGKDIELIELKGYTREEVMLLLNACNVALLTSFSEGSPQFIKEAMACNCPIVSTNVGSTEEIFDYTEGCYLSTFDPNDVAKKLNTAIAYGKRTNGSCKIQRLNNNLIAEKLLEVYNMVLHGSGVSVLNDHSGNTETMKHNPDLMKVLFVSREKKNTLISPIVQAQADSISGMTELSIYGLKGKGWLLYIKGISVIRKYLKTNKANIIHAHYSYVGIIASFASRKPVVVSLMGSDIEGHPIGRILIRLFAWLRWNTTIVKSQSLKNHIKIKKARILPNGVNLEIFQAHEKTKARNKLGLNNQMKYVLFLADPGRKEKNYNLAAMSCRLLAAGRGLEAGSWELLVIHDKAHSEIPLYLSAADVLILTSHFEGSPNAIKEAMACNCPIVSTDVGDVKEVIGGTEGCYITLFDPQDIAAKLKLALDFGKRTNGREKISHLDSKVIAERLINIYKEMLH